MAQAGDVPELAGTAPLATPRELGISSTGLGTGNLPQVTDTTNLLPIQPFDGETSTFLS